tara:strand:- start:36 stop:1382 length:1347 start_codon:yes stop_codon:yes gene_type:complete
MSKYNLTDILNEYVGGGRIGTLKISYRDLVDKMDQLEQSGKAVVRELSGPSGDGKVNREFEVVTNTSAVPGGNKQERGFTVYDYKFGFDPGSIDNSEEEYNFSVGGNDLEFAMELIPDIVPYRMEEEVDEAMMIDPDLDNKKMGKEDPEFHNLKNEEEELNEGDLFSSEFDRAELKDIINDLNKGLILDMPTRRAYKFLVSLLDKQDKEEMGLNEQMYIDDEEFEMEMGRSKKDSLKKEMMIHVDQLIDGNIDMNDFINVVEEIMAEVSSMNENVNPMLDAATASRIGNALNRNTRKLFLDRGKELIQDLFDKDLTFSVDDIVTHLANELQDSYNKMQDSKKEVEVDVEVNEMEDEGTAVSYSDNIDEADNIEISTLLNNIRKHLNDKFDRKYTKPEFDLYIDSLKFDIKQGKLDQVMSTSMQDHEVDFETYILDRFEDLREEFSRFM